MPVSDNNRIAKNAVALTLRMVLVTLVGLYTSRIVLQALGLDDYGIFGVIGGVVGMASFLNTAMAGATSRFITFELGKGDATKLKGIFSTALIIHLMIASGVFILAETIGLWFVNYKMNFPAERMFAVNVLYQFSILSMIVSFTQVPYTATIIAHEKMSIYAYLEIVNVFLKLLIVYLLLAVTSDRLILYSGLLLAVSATIAFTYRFYCIRHFKESHFRWNLDKETIKEMLKYSGMDLYGNMCAIAKSQGQPILLNIFFGVVANAGASISLAVVAAINGFTSSILQAFRPQIIKQYSTGRTDLSEMSARRAAQFTLLALSIIAIPVIVETPSLLWAWLGQIPEYAVPFTRLVIISSMLGVVINVNNTCIHATGNIRNISFISGSCYLLCPVFSYLWIRLGGTAVSIYIIDIVMMLIVTLLGWYFISKQIKDFAISRYVSAIFKSWCILGSTLLIVWFVMSHTYGNEFAANGQYKWAETIARLGIATATSFICGVVMTWGIAFNKSERSLVIDALKRKIPQRLRSEK